MYLAGVSVRRVEDITEALWGTRVSAGTVSELNKKVYERIELWRNDQMKDLQRNVLKILDTTVLPVVVFQQICAIFLLITTV